MNRKRWSIDTERASVTIVATSSVHPIRTSGSVSGWFEAALADTAFTAGEAIEGRLEIPLDELSSGNPLIDREMRRRTDIGVHSVIVAEIETAEPVGGSTALVTGTVEFLGVETLVEGEVSVVPGPRLTGVGEFDVRWWNLEPPKLLMLRVDPVVTVEIDLPLI